MFVETMIPDLTPEEVNTILGSVERNTWLYQPGLAPVELDFTTPETDEATQLALDYISLGGASSPSNY